MKLTHEEYEDILNRYYKWEDVSCTCFQCPPCSRCVDGPSDEEVAAMKAYAKEHNL